MSTLDLFKYPIYIEEYEKYTTFYFKVNNRIYRLYKNRNWNEREGLYTSVVDKDSAFNRFCNRKFHLERK